MPNAKGSRPIPLVCTQSLGLYEYVRVSARGYWGRTCLGELLQTGITVIVLSRFQTAAQALFQAIQRALDVTPT